VLRRLFPHLRHRFALSQDEFSHDVLIAVFVVRHGWYATYGRGGDAFEFEGDAAAMVAHLSDSIRR
jgi:hypothetical protein